MLSGLVGLLDWFNKEKRARRRAERHEHAEQLGEAIEDYLLAGDRGDAARLLLLRAESQVEMEARLAAYERAARIDEGGRHGRLARQRSAALRFDLVRHTGAMGVESEMRRLAEELEASEHWDKAREAYELLNDDAGVLRALEGAGDIAALEHKLESDHAQARHARDRAALVRTLRDKEKLAERHDAISLAKQWLARSDHDPARPEQDEAIETFLRRIRASLISAPQIELDIEGQRQHVVLGEQVTIGRTRADIVIDSSAISRQHLRIFRRDGMAHVEDLETRNGTLLAGARIGSALPISSELNLLLAGQIPCTLRPVERGVLIDVAGNQQLAPLGPLHIGPWRLFDAHDGQDHFVRLCADEPGSGPFKGPLGLRRQVELAVGDALSTTRSGPILLAVPAQETLA